MVILYMAILLFTMCVECKKFRKIQAGSQIQAILSFASKPGLQLNRDLYVAFYIYMDGYFNILYGYLLYVYCVECTVV